MLPKKARILIVDDDPEILLILEHLLRRSDYEPYVALNGFEGLRRVEELKPDLLIVDMMMPLMTGPQLIQALRTNPAYTRLPVLVMSSLSRLDDKNEAFRAGADDYLTKPTRPADFLARVQTMLSRTYSPFRQEGQLIALLDSCQTTSTVPLNLAVSMALHDHRVVLAELYTGRGVVRHYVEVPAGFTSSPLVALDDHEATRFTFEPYLLRHSSGLVTLPAMANPFFLTANQAQRIVTVLGEGQDYMMADLGQATQAVKQMITEMADHILLTSETTPEGVGKLCRKLELLIRGGVDHKVSIVLVGGPVPGRNLGQAEVEREIERLLFRPEHRVVAAIPSAPDLHDRAAQLSLPLVMYDPASPPARAYTELALWLAQQEPANDGRVLSVTS